MQQHYNQQALKYAGRLIVASLLEVLLLPRGAAAAQQLAAPQRETRAAAGRAVKCFSEPFVLLLLFFERKCFVITLLVFFVICFVISNWNDVKTVIVICISIWNNVKHEK